MTNHYCFITPTTVADTSKRIAVSIGDQTATGLVSGVPVQSGIGGTTFTATSVSGLGSLTVGVTYCVAIQGGWYGQGVATGTGAISVPYWLNSNPALSGSIPTTGNKTTVFGTSAVGSKSPMFTAQFTTIEQIIIHSNVTANTTLSLLDAGNLGNSTTTAFTTFLAQFATTAGTNILPYPVAVPLGKDGIWMGGPFGFICSVGAQLTASIYYRVSGGDYPRVNPAPNTSTL